MSAVTQILLSLSKLCAPAKKIRVQQQRLLKNMGAHTVVLDLLQIPYEKVCERSFNVYTISSVFCRFHNQALAEFVHHFRRYLTIVL